MGIFSKIAKWFKSPKLKDIEVEYDITNSANRQEYIRDISVQIRELEQETAVLSKEFNKLTLAITDMQRFDKLNKSSKDEIREIAQKILSANGECQASKDFIATNNEQKYKHLKANAETIKADMVKIKELEEQQASYKSDLNHLEGEYGELSYLRSRLIFIRSAMRVFGFVSVAVIAIMLVVLVVMMSYKADIMIPSCVLLAYAVLSVFIIFVNRRKVVRGLQIVAIKQGKAVVLLDKIKIKYVYTTNFLEYSYQKYHVSSYSELMYQYQQYSNIMNEKRRYKNAAEGVQALEKRMKTLIRMAGLKEDISWQKNYDALLNKDIWEETKDEYIENRDMIKDKIANNDKMLQTYQYKLEIVKKTDL